MSKQADLNGYIARVRRALQLRAGLRGAVLLLAVALLGTLLAVLLLNREAFPADGVSRARLLLVTVFAAAAGFGIAWPLLRLSRQRAVQRAEARFATLNGSLTTFHQRQDASSDPFLELLAADTLRRTEAGSFRIVCTGGVAAGHEPGRAGVPPRIALADLCRAGLPGLWRVVAVAWRTEVCAATVCVACFARQRGGTAQQRPAHYRRSDQPAAR